MQALAVILSGVQYGLLGEMQVLHGDRTIPLGGHRNAALLAFLVINANRPVRAQDIVEALWGADGGSRLTTLQAQVHRLRRQLPRSTIETTRAGYRIVAAPDAVDARCFEAALAAARAAQAAGADDQCALRAGEALRLWRGPALADLLDHEFAAVEHARLEEQRLDVEELHAGALLNMHREEAVSATERLVLQAPLREKRWVLRMTALYRAGRQAEALATYAHARTFLRDELGVEPGLELKDTHQQLLRHEPSPASPRSTLPPEPLRVRYARTASGVYLAYEAFGAGPSMVFAAGSWSGLTVRQNPLSAPYAAQLGRCARVICYDARGLGLSDALGAELPTMDDRAEEMLAVAAAETSRPVVLYGFDDGGPAAVHAAATRPDLVAGLILHNGAPRSSDVDRRLNRDGPDITDINEDYERLWGTGFTIDWFAPSLAADPRARQWWAHGERHAARPSEALRLNLATEQIDVSADLPLVRAPTLILHTADNAVLSVEHGRFVAEQIRHARLVELPGADHALWLSGAAALPHIHSFLHTTTS